MQISVRTQEGLNQQIRGRNSGTNNNCNWLEEAVVGSDIQGVAGGKSVVIGCSRFPSPRVVCSVRTSFHH